MRNAGPRLRPSWVLLGVGIFFWGAFLSLTPFESHDLWWHLTTGAETLRRGWPPRQNLFSFTAPDY
ncbi:MAG: hypothetical protein QHJ73_03360, partial [Armatimonadota bacterium]|nr:hypothetical protein [Armatimonadota bacterium]